MCLFIAAEIDMFCSDQKCVAKCEQMATSQHDTTRQIRKLLCDYIIVFQLILQSVGSFILTAMLSAFTEKDRMLSIKVLVVYAPA